MRIGVNALYLIPGGVGGTEIYLRNLLKALAALRSGHHFTVYTNVETGDDLVPQEFEHVRLPVKAVNRPGRLLYEQFALPRRTAGIDVLLNPGFTAPALGSCPNVTVFHDLQHKRHPEYFRWFDKPAWDFFLWLAVRGSQILLADSEATRADLTRFYGVESRVAPLGVEEEFFRIAEQRRPEPFLLCASTLHPHKNIERLVRVFSRYRAARPEMSLVLAGMKGFHTGPVEKLITSLGLESSVRVTGWIPREELLDLFRRATAFVYPSTFEGFGLPVIEAMAAGVPLACSDIEPLRSITAGCAWLFDPSSDDAMLHALQTMTSEKVKAAQLRAAGFTWKRCAEITLDALTEAGLRAGSSSPSSHRGTSR